MRILPVDGKVTVNELTFTNKDLCNYMSFIKDSSNHVNENYKGESIPNNMIWDFFSKTPVYYEYDEKYNRIKIVFGYNTMQYWHLQFDGFNKFMGKSSKYKFDFIRNGNKRNYCFNLDQENIYSNSNFLDNKWYRELFGGKWYRLKLGKDTPNIGMFTTWTKRPDWLSGYKAIIDVEKYPKTYINTKWQVFKQLIKNIYKKFTVKL